MDLSPETALTMLTSLYWCHIWQYLNTKYIQIARAIFTDQSVNSSANCVYTNADKIWISNKKCVTRQIAAKGSSVTFLSKDHQKELAENVSGLG